MSLDTYNLDSNVDMKLYITNTQNNQNMKRNKINILQMNGCHGSPEFESRCQHSSICAVESMDFFSSRGFRITRISIHQHPNSHSFLTM